MEKKQYNFSANQTVGRGEELSNSEILTKSGRKPKSRGKNKRDEEHFRTFRPANDWTQRSGLGIGWEVLSWVGTRGQEYGEAATPL